MSEPALHRDAAPDPTLRRSLEAVLLVVDEPTLASTFADAVGAPVEDVLATLYRMRDSYLAEGRGFVLREVAGGWRLYTDPGATAALERFALHGRSGRLSRAALETLAIVAYQQPITRARVSQVRGVEADGAVRSLVARGLVEEVGRDTAPGQPLLYGTTPAFLEQLGLSTLDELPSLPELGPDGPPPAEPPLGGYRAARRELDALGTPLAGAPTTDEDPPGQAPDESGSAVREDDAARGAHRGPR